jgi:hypothetical protein
MSGWSRGADTLEEAVFLSSRYRSASAIADAFAELG